MAVTPTPQMPASAVARVDATDRTAAQVWQAIAESEGFRNALVDAVRDVLAGVPRLMRPHTLKDAGVTASSGVYATILTSLDRPAETWRHALALETTTRFGSSGLTGTGDCLPLEGLSEGPLAALDAADASPTLAVRLSASFREQGYERRHDVVALLARLGEVCDVRVVTTCLTARWMAREHRGALPSSFREAAVTTLRGEPPITERVDAARDVLDPEDTAVAILRTLADEPGETLSYSELVESVTVKKARVSQILGDLEALDLAERFGPRTDKHVELLPAGTAFVDALGTERGRQVELDAEFSDPGQNSKQCRVTPQAHGEGEGEATDATAGTALYRTRYASRTEHHAAAATAADGSITAAEDLFDTEEIRTRWVSYNPSRSEGYIAVRASGPLQYIVSTALSLASPEFFDRALPVSRLNNIDDSAATLRDARCIGGVSDEAANDGQVLRDTLVKWGKVLAQMTTKLKHGKYDDRNRFRGEIMRSAHGLAGSIVHLLDTAGIDLVRELRVPQWLPHEKLAALAKTVSLATAIQSKYGVFTVYRQVFEQREEKRRAALSPDVDAANPFGEFIGGMVLRGPDANRLARHVEGHLATPGAIHEDAPEIAVRVPVGTTDRSVFAETVTQMCQEKNLAPTREAVTVLRALMESPYAVAEALYALGAEDTGRGLCLDEVRMALATLDADRILPDAPPTARKAVQVLLRSATPLSQAELAEAADVSARSLRRHVECLAALTVVQETDEGLRFALPTRDERGADIRPAVLDDQNAARQDLLFDVALAVVDDTDRFGDPTDHSVKRSERHSMRASFEGRFLGSNPG
ncbi:hypothetical protein [Halopelagius fulvigenes]|uniref:Uncharacterized protein n=1 Tax=Halopelagius fulvigenes TaxID=1198324 RepID=A0ABD5U288_9EURY